MSIHSIPKDLENVNIEIEEGTGEILQEPQFALKKKCKRETCTYYQKINKHRKTDYDGKRIFIIYGMW